MPPAREEGLGLTFTRRIPVWWTLTGLIALGGAAARVHPWRGPLAVGLAVIVVLLLTWRAVRRFGGVTGDVYGAAIEVALATLLLGLAGA